MTYPAIEAFEYRIDERRAIRACRQIYLGGVDPPIGNIPPAEAEQRYYAMLDEIPMAA